MAKLVKTKCPECGARLEINPEADKITCEYCGGVSLVEDKKKKKDQPPPAAQTPGMPVQPVIRINTGASWTWLIYILIPIFMVFGIGGFSVFRACGSLGEAFQGFTPTSGPGSGSGTGQSFGERMQWIGHKQPMLADVNGDGVMDLIGWIRFLNTSGGNSFDHIGAFNAIDGQRLWKTGPITDSSQLHNTKVAMSGDKILVGDTTGVLKAYSIYNGQVVWNGMLGERTDRICGDSQGFVRVETKDKRALKVNLMNGQITPAGTVQRDAICTGIQTDGAEDGLYSSLGGGTWNTGGIVNPKIVGMKVEKVLIDKVSRATIALGYRRPGTGVPMAALYNSSAGGKKGKKKITAKWLTVVPSVNPLTVEEDAPEVAAVSSGRIIIPYAMQNSEAGWRLSCIDLNGGRNLWDQPIPRSGTGDVDGLAVSDRQIFAAHWTYLDVFDLGTGQHQYTIGVW